MSNQLVVENRTVQGKKLKALRKAGKVPAVVYGQAEPILVESEYNPTERVLLEVGYHSPVELMIAGKPQLAIVKDVAVDPISRRIINVEFQAISADEVVEATTPITIVNFESSEASKLHYVLAPVFEEIEIKAKPADLPEELVVDGAKLATLEDKLVLADLALPKGVEFANKDLTASTVIATVYDPAAEAAAREAAEAAAKAAAAEAAPAAEAATEPAAEASAEKAE